MDKLGMTRVTMITIALLGLSIGLCFADQRYQPIVISVRPEASIPLEPDHMLFQIGAGASASASYVLPFFRALSAGVAVSYNYSGMQHASLGYLGSLSIVAAQVTAEARITIARLVDLYLTGGGGFFYTLVNEDPTSYASNFAFSGRVGGGYRVLPTLTIGLHVEYRRYETLCHMIVAGLTADLRVGSNE